MTDMRRDLFDYLGIDLEPHELLTDDRLVDNLEAIDRGLWRPGRLGSMHEERRTLLKEALTRASRQGGALTEILSRKLRTP
jgi:hypothetical protein